MSAPTKKAPDLLEQGEGKIPEGTDMKTVAPTTDNLPIKDRKTIHINRAEYTSEEIAFSVAEGTKRLEVRYALREKPRVACFATPDGETFRNAGAAVIRECRDGVRRFVAFVHDDATQHDFLYLDRRINDARNGRMDMWSRHTFDNGDEGWILDYTNYQFDDDMEFKPAFVIIEEASPIPGVVGYGSAWGYPCTEPLCREKLHDAEEIDHTLDKIEKPLSKWGGFEIEICKDAKKPDSDWYLNIWAGSDLSELTPDQVASFANDLNWMAIECTNANAKARILRRNPEITDELKERDQ